MGWRLLRTIIAPEGSSYCVRHAEEEVSFAFIVVKSMPVPGVSCMPERQTDSERSFNIDACLQTVCNTLREHSAASVCMCVLHQAHPPSTLSWAAGWFSLLSPLPQHSLGSLTSSAADLITKHTG